MTDITSHMIKQGNTLIALFMDGKLTDVKFGKRGVAHKVWQSLTDDRLCGIPEYQALCYHQSYEWLMPACKKWNNLCIWDDFIKKHWASVRGSMGTQIGKDYVDYCDRLDDAVTRNYDPMDAFRQLVTNITWYNRIKKYQASSKHNRFLPQIP